jgi:hypothetical protein
MDRRFAWCAWASLLLFVAIWFYGRHCYKELRWKIELDEIEIEFQNKIMREHPGTTWADHETLVNALEKLKKQTAGPVWAMTIGLAGALLSITAAVVLQTRSKRERVRPAPTHIPFPGDMFGESSGTLQSEIGSRTPGRNPLPTPGERQRPPSVDQPDG